MSPAQALLSTGAVWIRGTCSRDTQSTAREVCVYLMSSVFMLVIHCITAVDIYFGTGIVTAQEVQSSRSDPGVTEVIFLGTGAEYAGCQRY